MPRIFNDLPAQGTRFSRKSSNVQGLIQQKQNINVSLQSDEKKDEQSFLQKLMNFFSDFNLCLRPQIQSRQLMTFLQNYQVDSLYQDPYYGECYALKSKQGDSNKHELNHTQSIFNTTQQKDHFRKIASLRNYLSMSKQRHYKKQYKVRRQTLDQISRYSGSEQNILRFTIISQFQKQQFLFTITQIYIAYDFILIDLQKQFENRIMQKRQFTESEINIIMKETCAGLVALENANYKSIRMSYIYFCQYGKQIKVAHPKMFNYQTNLQAIARNSEQKGVYLSPEELDLLQKNQVDEQGRNSQFLNSFTFGMVILSLMCNKYLNEVYDYRTCEINFNQIQELLNNLANTYSQRLINIVSKLLKLKNEERMPLRTLLNVLQQKFQLTEHIEITLIKQHVEKQLTKAEKYAGYKPLFQQQPEETRHKNYLYGMVYPKIGNFQQYYHYNDTDPFKRNLEGGDVFQPNQQVIANHRYSYEGFNNKSKYIGSSMPRDQLSEKPLKEGRGLYILEDGQSYLGEWKDNQMYGYGKLYWPEKKIRYQGQFERGLFHGFGTQYAQFQIPQRQQEIDSTFVRLHKGSWLRYQGRFKQDKKEGPGKAYFRNGLWIGNFKDGQPNGYGVWQGSDGQKLKGVWRDGYYEPQPRHRY